MTVNIIRGYKEIQQGIQTFHKSVAHVDETVHMLACSALTHAAEHGDSSLCTLLVQSMPKSSRRQALIDWNETFGNIKWTMVGEEQKFKKVKDTECKLEEAYETPFYDLTPDKSTKPFDMSKLLKMLDGVIRKVEKGKEAGTLSVNSESFALLNVTVSKLLQEVRPEAIMEAAMRSEVKQAA